MTGLYWKTFIKDLPQPGKNRGMNALFAFLGQVSFPLSLYIGLQYTSSLNAAIYISSNSCLVLAINCCFFRDRISVRNIIGVLASTAGVLYLALSSAQRGVKRFSWVMY